MNWARIARHYVQRGSLRYSEVRTIAERLGQDAARPRDDAELRIEFARRLRLAAQGRPKFTPEQLLEGRIRALATFR